MTDLTSTIVAVLNEHSEQPDAAAAALLFRSASRELRDACTVCLSGLSIRSADGPELLKVSLGLNGTSEALWSQVLATQLLVPSNGAYEPLSGARRVAQQVLEQGEERHAKVHEFLLRVCEGDLEAARVRQLSDRALTKRWPRIRHAYHLTALDGHDGGLDYRAVYTTAVNLGLGSDQRTVEDLAAEQEGKLTEYGSDIAFYKGQAAYRRKDANTARHCFTTVLNGPPTFFAAIAAHLLGRMERRLEEEERYYDRSLGIVQSLDHRPVRHCASVLVSWGDSLTKARRFAKADKKLQEASALDPDNVYVWQAWGLLEERQGDYKKAREYFKRAVEADPTSAPSWQAWGLLEERQGDYKKAREYFKRAVEADPTNAPSWQAWGLLEERQGDDKKERGLLDESQRHYDKAGEYYGRAVEADPTDAPSWQAWGNMERKVDNLDEAVRLLRRAAEVQPEAKERARSYCALARAQRHLGDRSGAEASYLEALRNEPDNPYARRELEALRGTQDI